MPFKWYHGKTGVVWNVTKRALGVEINKRVSIAICSFAVGSSSPRLSDVSPLHHRSTQGS
jgi:hypothetical protein